VEWKSTISDVNMTEHISIPMTSSSYQLRPVKKRVICARVNLKALRENVRSWTGGAEYYLEKSNDGLHIIHANIPFNEIEAFEKP
jgi:hypothetical protein